MLYPSIHSLTNDKINRYKLVIATAKCARYITQKALEEREAAESHKETERFSKDSKSDISNDAANDKAVTGAVGRLYDGTYKIIAE
jgi:hypothetical protein